MVVWTITKVFLSVVEMKILKFCAAVFYVFCMFLCSTVTSFQFVWGFFVVVVSFSLYSII